MSSNSESEISQNQKRPLGNASLEDNRNKKQRTASAEGTDDQLDTIFNGQIPGLVEGESNTQLETEKDDVINIDFDNLPAEFLDNDPLTGSDGVSNLGTPDFSSSNLNQLTDQKNNGSNVPTPKQTSVNQESRSTTPIALPVVNNPQVKVENKPAIKSTSYQNFNAPIDRMNPLVQQAHGIHGLNTSNIDRPFSSTTIGTPGGATSIPASSKQQLHTNDPSKLNDAIAAAGVNIQQEEEILLQHQLNRRSDVTREQKLAMRASKPAPFLNSYHVAAFMNKIARENGVTQNFLQDGDILELMSASCENWLSNILTKTILLSRHRRRGIPNLNNKGKNVNSMQRSDLSKELKNLASKQKEQEERRVNKRIALGLESNGPNSSNEADPNNSGKAGAEETLHRAANATAAMMTMNPGRKKYSWMTANSRSSDEKNVGSEKEGAGKQSSIISIRGDNGLRYREIRSGNSITMKDLLGAIEDERMGTQKAVIKGYAKLKD